ncbi:MAG: glutamine--fructose-6-phosphate transaminase (isomerizing) [Candidatus Altiarchaeales archaeon]|nr:glutamine--fructose-6-phosphate transaminase (isomerizing) [Candidatus Altiarchaeales archaeon]MBD3415927.1 glutamine--fructose-6-phosphate transaminase (isomerizing) [Candidatus Altiarchaeales archaeon]
MCGIAGYVGGKNAPVVLFDMLKRLEYRGYDSAGIAYVGEDGINIPKGKGKVDEVRASLNPESLMGQIGVGHTRWATHGVPSTVNAHPHTDCTGVFAVAHNGIIENFLELKDELEERGHSFKSETDTEVIAHLIEEYYDGDFLEAFAKALGKLKGSYAITALSTHHRDMILVARNESPLLIGLGEGENFIASDAPAFLGETKEAVILDDLEYGVVTAGNTAFYSLKSGRKLRKKHETLSWSFREAERGGYHHFMLKEVHEEPDAAVNALKGEKELRAVCDKISSCRRVYFVACGTAYHAGLYGKYLMERLGLAAEASIASEFRYSTAGSLNSECAVIAISQSGETADTIAAVKAAKARGAYTACIVNVVGSSLTRLCDDSAYTYSGPEIAVASTKAYIGQLVSVALLSLESAKKKMKLDEKDFLDYFDELKNIRERIQDILDSNEIRALAESEANTRTFFYLGRRENYPTALEGALKLKEISYVHAEGYAAGELKHGPLALMDETVTVLAIMPDDELKRKVESNISEIKARGAKVITVGVNKDIRIPKTYPIFAPILAIVPLHLFAYYISVLKGLDPDKPRNLAKSVTVE